MANGAYEIRTMTTGYGNKIAKTRRRVYVIVSKSSGKIAEHDTGTHAYDQTPEGLARAKKALRELG
jgi:hypothetical protein